MDNWKIVNSTVLSKFGCQTQISNGVDRPDPTVHKYLKLKQVNLFNEKKMYPETLKPQPRLKCYLYHSFLFFVINPVKSI